MKRYCSTAIAAILMFSLVSCGNFQIPESVSIKTDAKFQAPLGTGSFGISSVFDFNTLRQTIQDALPNSQVYDYIMPEKPDVQNYLVNYPIPDLGDMIPTDMLNNLNLGDALGSNFPMTIPIPISTGQDLSQDFSAPITLPEFAQYFTNLGAVNFDTDEFSEGPVPSIPTSLMPEATVKGGNDDLSYTRIYYSAGKIKLTFTQKDSNSYSNGYHLYLKATIYDGSNIIASSNNGNLQDITENPVLEIPMTASQGLPSTFKVKFEGNASGGNSSVKHTLNVKSTFDGMQPTKVEGVTANGSALGLDENSLKQEKTLDLSGKIPSGVKSLKFSGAKLKFKVNAPEGWSGVFLEIDDENGGLAFSGTGLTTHSLTSTSANDGSLINKTYTWDATIDATQATSIKATIKPTVRLQNATIALNPSQTTVDVQTETSLSLKNIDEIVVDLNALTNGGLQFDSLPHTLPSTLIQYIRGIRFKEYASDVNGNATSNKREGLGFKCSVTNTLPAGNDIALNVKLFTDQSDSTKYYFDKELVIPSNATDKAVNCIDYPNIQFPAYDENQSEFDFGLDISIKNANNFTLKNIELGKDYSINLTINDFVLDWDSISFSLLNAGIFPKSDSKDFPFDIKEMTKSLPIPEDLFSALSLHTLPVYLYVQRSENLSFLDSINFAGKMYISYKKDGIPRYVDILNKTQTLPLTYKNIGIVNTAIPWPADTSIPLEGKPSDPSNVAYYLSDAHASASIDLKDVLSDLMSMEEPKINYEINAGSAPSTIYKSAIENAGQGETKLGISIAFLLSLDIDLKSQISVDLLNMDNMEIIQGYNTPDENGQYSDLLNRTSADDYAEYAQYADLIENVGIEYTLNNNLIKGDGLSIILDVNDVKGETGVHKSAEFSNGHHSLDFNKEDIKNVMTKYPFHPDILIKLGRDYTNGESKATGYNSPVNFYLSRSGISDPKALSAKIIAVVNMDGNTSYKIWQK
ncbi:MAG: hypothetical protein II563_01565 [Treponema sp.]|nr:hypothetical protein [Treponema sp.]